MRLIKALAAAALVGSVTSSLAGVTLDLENVATDPTSTNLVGNAYASYGISFGDGLWALNSSLTSYGQDGYGYGNLVAHSGSGVVGLFTDPYATPNGGLTTLITSTTGFGTSFSLWYALDATGGVVPSVDILDINGNSLLTDAYALTVDGTTGCSTAEGVCNWTQATITFSGVAYYVQITGADGYSFFDDLSFGDLADTPTTELPEPASIGLALAGLGAAALVRRRTRRAG